MMRPIVNGDSREALAPHIAALADARVVILFHRLGPYHEARLVAAARECRIGAVEVTTVDSENFWRSSESRYFQKWTLFDQSIERESTSEFERRLDRVLRQLSPKVVFIPGWGTWWAIAGIRSCLRIGARVVVMSDSVAKGPAASGWKEVVKRRIVGLCAAALVAGKPHVDYLRALGMPVERIFTGYDVVDNEHFAAGATDARRQAARWRLQLGLPQKYFLASGRFIEVKNISGLLHAYARYQRRIGRDGWGLVLLGEGPLRSEIERTIDELGLRQFVVIAGFKQYDELPVYYGLADVFVHASIADTWGLVVNEAMAAGLPVLVSARCGCASDLVRPGANGFTFDPSNPDTLAEQMLAIASDDCDRTSMAEASRQIIGGWSPRRFAASCVAAARAAIGTPERRALPLDRALLWALAHR